MQILLEDLVPELLRNAKRLEAKGEYAIEQAKADAVRILVRRAPKVFLNLADSIHSNAEGVVIDAPYAAAVERGSRPHWMPLEPLVEWVRRRGAQGLRSPIGANKHNKASSRLVAGQLAAMVKNGASPVDAPREIARAIQFYIAKNGTRPTWFVRNSMPEIKASIARNIRRALKS